jgi:benzoylformate decarboxylase
MRGQEALLETLIAEGVECVFGNPGSTELGLYDALQNYPDIKFYLGLHETVAMAMADAYARVKGKPAVVNIHIAPGLANSLSMLYNAYCGGTPLVITAGQQSTDILIEEPVLAADMVSMARPFTKWSVEVGRTNDISPALRRAFKVAMTPPFGPVFLSLPINILAEEADVTIERPQRLHIRTRPETEAVAKATDLLCQAQHPVMVLGDRVAQSRAVGEAVQLAEILGAKVYASPTRSEVCFPTSHPQYLGTLNIFSAEAIAEALGGADVMLAVGTSVFPAFSPSTKPLISKKTQLIHMDCNTWEIGKIYPVKIGIVADAKAGLDDLAESLAARMSDAAHKQAEERKNDIKKEKDRLRKSNNAMLTAAWDNVPITEGRMLSELRQCLPPEAVLVDQASTTTMGLHASMDFKETGAYFGFRGGSLGWGLPAALGVKVALPERPVVAVLGDGEAMFSIQGLWTAAHYKISVTFIICGNASYEILKMNMLKYLNALGQPQRKSDFIGMDLTQPALDFAKIAQAFGIWGKRVENPGELNGTLKEAMLHKGPAVVDVAMEGALARMNRLKGGS